MANTSVATNNLVKTVIDRWAKTSPTYGAPSYAKIGIGNQTALTTATSITTPAPIANFEVIDNCDATTGWTAGTDGVIALNTTSGEFIEGTGSLNLQKTGTTATSVTYSKTTTSVNFTSKDLWVWLYITDLTDLKSSGTCVEVRFGSDSTNYYYKQYAASSLSNGANWLYFSTATATGTTGSPTISACDYTAIILTVDASSDTYTSNRIRLDHIQVASSTDYESSFDTGPTVNSTSSTSSQSIKLNTTYAVGQNVTNTGWFTSDGTLYGIDQFTADVKTQEEEWTIQDEVQVLNRL